MFYRDFPGMSSLFRRVSMINAVGNFCTLCFMPVKNRAGCAVFSHFAQFVIDSTVGFILYWTGRNHLRSQDNFFWPQQVYIAG